MMKDPTWNLSQCLASYPWFISVLYSQYAKICKSQLAIPCMHTPIATSYVYAVSLILDSTIHYFYYILT